MLLLGPLHRPQPSIGLSISTLVINQFNFASIPELLHLVPLGWNRDGFCRNPLFHSHQGQRHQNAQSQSQLINWHQRFFFTNIMKAASESNAFT